MITDNFCLSLFYNGDEMISLNHKPILFKENKGLKEYLENRFSDTQDTSEVLYRIKNSLNGPQTCICCGKPTRYSKSKKKYSLYCSAKCQNSDPNKIQKTSKTKEERYGDPNYNNMQKQQKTCLEKYGAISFTQTQEFKEKTKNSNLERYGCEWLPQSKEFHKKSKETKKIKYGNANYNNREKAEITTLEKYGVKNTKQSSQAKEKEKETCLKKYGVTSYTKTDEYKEKTKNTFIHKYGVTHNTKSREWKEKWYSNKEWVNNRNNSILQTMLKNNSFKQSKTENILLEYLKSEYPDVIYQHKDIERYPFKCDFYIPSLDLFIEYNGYWTHGSHPFDPLSEKDINKLKNWQKKENKQYKIAIKVWTKTDPLKREIAKKNNLNFIELWYDAFENLETVKTKIESFRK